MTSLARGVMNMHSWPVRHMRALASVGMGAQSLQELSPFEEDAPKAVLSVVTNSLGASELSCTLEQSLEKK